MDLEVLQGHKGGAGKQHTPVEEKNTLLSKSYAKVLLAIGEGEFAGTPTAENIFLDGTPLKSAGGLENFGGVKWEYRSGRSDQSYITGVPDVSNEFAINLALTDQTPWTRLITTQGLDAVRVTLAFPAVYEQKDNGDIVGYNIEYAIDLSTNGGAYVEQGKWSTNNQKTTVEYNRTHRINLTKPGTSWTLRIRRLTPNKNNGKFGDTMSVKSIAEVIDAKLRYPNTALLFVEFDAETFGGSSIPKISIKTKGRMVQVPSNYTPETRTYTGVWNGTFKWAWTNNPAWVFYDLVTNERFGLGSRITPDMVDKWTLYQVAQYCDVMVPDGKGGTEPRYTCNIYIQSRKEAWQVLRDVVAIFNGMLHWSGTQIVATADMPVATNTLRTYNRSDVVDGKFTYGSTSEKTISTTALVSFDDPDNHYETAVEAVNDLTLVQRYKTWNQAEIAAIGVTSRGQAQRKGKYQMLTNSLNRMVTFKLGLNGYLPRPGEVIGIADQVLAGSSFSGRISAATLKTVTCDRVPNCIAGDILYVNKADGTTGEGRTIQSVNGKVITVTANYSAIPTVELGWYVEKTTLKSQLYRITKVTWAENDAKFEVTGVQYEDSKYAAIDNGARLESRPITSIPAGGQDAPTGLVLSSFTFIEQTLAVTTLSVKWNPAQGAMNYEAQWRKDGGDWINVGNTASTGFDVKGIYSGAYQARVRAINAIGTRSVWVESANTQLNGKVGLPPATASFTTSSEIFGIRLSWTFPSGADDTAYIQLQQGTTLTGGTVTELSMVAYPATSYVKSNMLGGVSAYFRARLIDRTGNEGPWSAWTYGVSEYGTDKILDSITGEIGRTELGQELLSELDTTKTDLTSVKQEVIDISSDVLAINQQVQANKQELEGQIQDASTQLAQQITNVNNSVTTLNQQVAGINQDIAAIEADVAADVSALNQDVADLTTRTTAVEAKATSLRTDLDAAVKAAEYDATKTYAVGDIVRKGQRLYQALVAVPVNKTPPNATYWKDVGTILQEAGATAAQVSTNTTTITNQGNTLTSHTSQLTGLTTRITNAETNITGNSTALSNLTSTVTQQGNTLTSQGQSITNVQATVDGIAGAGVNLLEDTYSWLTSTTMPTVPGSSGLVKNAVAVVGSDSGFGYQVDTSLSTFLMLSPTNTAAGRNVSLVPGTYLVSMYVAASVAGQMDVSLYDGTHRLSARLTQPTTRTRMVFPITVTDTVRVSITIYTNRTAIANHSVVIDSVMIEKRVGATNVASPFVPGSSAIAVTNAANATTALTARVTSAEGTITSQGTSITNLTNRVTNAEGTLTSQGTAISGLTSTVTSQGNTLTSQGSSITNLQASVGNIATDNLLNDPTFANSNGLTSVPTAVVINRNDASAPAGAPSARIVKGSAATSTGNLYYGFTAAANNRPPENGNLSQISVQAGEVYDFELYSYVTVSRGQVGLWTQFYDASGASIGHNWVVQSGDGVRISTAVGQWVKLTGTTTVPANCIRMAMTYRLSAGDATDFYISSPVARKRSGQDNSLASATTALDARVTSAEGTITSQGSSITNLTSSLSTTNGNVTAAQQAAQAASDLAGSKGKVIVQSTAPAVADRLAQNLWIDTTSNANTPKRWNGSAWVAVTDKVATDAASAAASALSQVATKADASAVTDLTSRVTATEGTVTSQGQAITSLNSTVSGISGTGSNLLPAEYCTFSDTAPGLVVGGGITAAVESDALAFSGYALKLQKNSGTATVYLSASTVFASANMAMKQKKYIVSMYVRAGTDGHQLRAGFRAIQGDGTVVFHYPSNMTVSTTWARHTTVIDMSASPADKMILCIDPKSGSGEYGVPVWVDRIMVEEQVGAGTTPSAFVIGNSATQVAAQGSAIQALTNRVTTAEGTISSQGSSITSLNNSLTTTNTNVTAAQAAADAANTLAGGKGKVLVQTATPAVADRLVQNLWIDITGGANTPKRWTGSTWAAVTDKVATDAATAAANALSQLTTKADASAVSALTSRVTSAEGNITSQGQSITNLNASVGNIGQDDVLLNPNWDAAGYLKTENGSLYQMDYANATDAGVPANPPAGRLLWRLKKTTDSNWGGVVLTSTNKIGSDYQIFTRANAGDVINISCHMFCENAVANAGKVCITPVDAAGETFGIGNIRILGYVSTTGGWQALSTQYTLPAGSAGFRVYLATEGVAPAGFKMWVGNMRVAIQSAGEAANAAATSALSSAVTQQGNTLTSQGSSITNLTNRMTTAEGTISSQGTAISGLNSTVTSQGNTLTSQGTAITSLNNSLSGIGGSGTNLLEDTYSWLSTTVMPPVSLSTAQPLTSVADTSVPSGYRYRIERGNAANPWMMLCPTNNSAGWNIPLTPGKYIVSFYANTNSAGVTNGLVARTGLWDGSTRGSADFTLTTTRTRYSVLCTAVNDAKHAVTIWFPVGVTGDVVWIDSIMVERQLGNSTEPSAFVAGPSAIGLTATSAALQSVTSRVSNAEGSITSQSGALTALKNSLGGSGTNLLPAEYSAFTATKPNLVYATVVGSTSADSEALNGYAYKVITNSTSTTSTIYTCSPLDDYASYNIACQQGKYILSYYAKAETAGHTVALFVRARNSAGSASNSSNAPQDALTTSWVRYSQVVDLSGSAFSDKDKMTIGIQINRSGVTGRVFYIDRIMLEKQVGDGTAPSTFTQGNSFGQVSATSEALSSLTNRVTSAEGTITSQGTAITNLTNTVNGKADASALNSLATRVTAAEGNITSQGSNITSLNNTVNNIGGSGSNLNPSEYSVFGPTPPTIGAISTGLTYSTVADSAALGGYALKFVTSSTSTTVACYLHTSNVVGAVGSFPISYDKAKYILSFYAKANVTGHQIKSFVRYVTSTATVGSSSSGTHNLTTDWVRYSYLVDMTSSGYSGNQMAVAFSLNTLGVSGREILIDRVMIEKQIGTSTEPSPFAGGSSYTATQANAAATQALTTRVTAAEGTITSQGQAITNLTSTVSGKADASAVSALTTRVTAVEGTVTSQGTSITNLTSTLNGIGGNGANLVPSQYSWLTGTVPMVSSASGLTITYVEDPNGLSGTRYRINVATGTSTGAYAMLLTSNTPEDWNIYLEPGEYLVSMYLFGTVTGGKFRVNLWNGNSSWGPIVDLTSTRQRFTMPVTVTTAGKYGLAVYPNQSGSPSTYAVYMDSVMVERKLGNATTASPFVSGPSSKELATTATAVNALTTRVTSAEGTIASQGTSLTNLTASLGAMPSENLLYDPTFTTEYVFSGNSLNPQFLARNAAGVPDGSPSSRVAKIIYAEATGNTYIGFQSALNVRPPENATTNQIAVAAGEIYDFEMYFYNTTTRQCGIWVQFYDASGASVDHNWVDTDGDGVKTSTTANQWMKHTGSRTVPATAIRMSMTFRVGAGAVATGYMAQPKATKRNAKVNATASAVTSLDARVTSAEGTITSQGSSITSLNTSLANKADNSALNALTSRVTTAEGNISSQGSAVTSLQSTLGNIAGAGNNLLSDEYSWLTSTTLPTTNGSATSVVGVAVSESASGFGYTMTSTSTSTGCYLMLCPANNAANWNIPVEAGTYIVSFYASAPAAASLRVRLYGATSNYSATQSLTTTRTRYTHTVTLSSAATVACLFYYNMNGVSGTQVTVDSVMVEKQVGPGTTASPFVAGPSARAITAQASALSSLQSTVTQQGTTISAQASSISGLNTTVGGHTTSINTISSTQNTTNGKLNTLYSVKLAINSNGQYYGAGMGIGIENTPSGMQSQVLFVADRFAILNSVNGTASSPFVVQNGQTFIADAFINKATVTNAIIGQGIYSAYQTNWGGPVMTQDFNVGNVITRHPTRANTYTVFNQDGVQVVVDGVLRVRMGIW